MNADLIELLQQAGDVWDKGGWAIYPLALNALILYTLAAWIQISLWGKGYRASPNTRIRRLQKAQEQGRAGGNSDLPANEYGVARAYLRSRDIHVSHVNSIELIQSLFEELRAREIPAVNRDLRVMRIAMSTAPLLGLLGTVTGMFSTFAALSQSTGGDSTVGSVASGISEALITTQTGLTIALPGYFLNYYLTRERDRLKEFLNHLEIVCTQSMRRDQADNGPDDSNGNQPTTPQPSPEPEPAGAAAV